MVSHSQFALGEYAPNASKSCLDLLIMDTKIPSLVGPAEPENDHRPTAIVRAISYFLFFFQLKHRVSD